MGILNYRCDFEILINLEWSLIVLRYLMPCTNIFLLSLFLFFILWAGIITMDALKSFYKAFGKWDFLFFFKFSCHFHFFPRGLCHIFLIWYKTLHSKTNFTLLTSTWQQVKPVHLVYILPGQKKKFQFIWKTLHYSCKLHLIKEKLGKLQNWQERVTQNKKLETIA